MVEGSASVTIRRPAAAVFELISDITRMGEWSPECVAGRWVAPATGPAVGARFEGDNEAKIGPLTAKRWTTTSEVTVCAPGEVFEFLTQGHTTWRYDLAERDGATAVTESFRHPPFVGWEAVVYGRLARRQTAMTKAMQRTLERIKQEMER